jgi:hypothetical protein
MIAALEGNTNPDAMVLLQMVKNGADLTKPHEPEFAFEALEKARATAIGNHLRSLGYDVSLYGPDEDNPNHIVVAKCTMVLELNVQGFQGDKKSAFILKGLEILARVFPQTRANHINMLGAPP